jgi:hypothetical protein
MTVSGVTPTVPLYARAVRKPVVIIVAAGLVLAGCSDDAADQGGLLGALGRVRATADTRKSVEYGEPAAVRGLVGDNKARYQLLQGYGYGSIASYSLKVKDTLGLDLTGFDGAIVAGDPPNQATTLWGEYDRSTVDKKLGDLKIDNEKGLGGTRWRAADDHEVNLDGPFTDVVPPAQFNDILTRDGAFAFSPASAGVEWVTEPGDGTLADDSVLAPLAKCLGDVVVARLQATGQAAGVRRDGTDVICLKADEDQVSKALKGDSPATGEPWDQLLPRATVDEAEGLARVTAPAGDDRPAGRGLQMMLNHDLDALTR